MSARDMPRPLTLAQVRWLDRLSELIDLHGLDRGLRPLGEILPVVLAQVESQVFEPPRRPRPASRTRARHLRELAVADNDFAST